MDKYKVLEIISCILSEHDGIKLVIIATETTVNGKTCEHRTIHFWTINGSLKKLKRGFKNL
jgi:hypothetical protein